MTRAKKAFALVAVAAALAGGAAAPALAGPAVPEGVHAKTSRAAAHADAEPGKPAVHRTDAGSFAPARVSYCRDFVNSGKRWKANCRVSSGRSGAYTLCTDGTSIRGPLVGVGYWKFGGDCSGHGKVKRWAVYNG
ncbi:hypothetical protein [Streptomyces sp. bgisy100]|uniref:hypothetical protein n=1 Tax=Streptomyces sp. bgisy100 TaxID=3413783 RepID=UPI003D762277